MGAQFDNFSKKGLNINKGGLLNFVNSKSYTPFLLEND